MLPLLTNSWFATAVFQSVAKEKKARLKLPLELYNSLQ